MRRKFTMRSIIIFSLFLSNGQTQTASEAIHILENEIGYGARSLGMGGAFTALGNDPSGMYWNPAGLADMANGAIYFEGQSLNYHNKTSYINESKVNPLHVGSFNAMGMALPLPTIRGSMVLGVGFNRIVHYNGLMSFSGFSNEDNQLNFPIEVDGKEQFYDFSKYVLRSEEIYSGGAMEQFTLSFGIALSPTFAGGLSVSRVSGREEYSFEFIQEDSKQNYSEFPADFDQYLLKQKLIATTTGWNIRGGVKGAVTDWFRLGLSISLPYHIRVEEEHSSDESLIFDDGFKNDTTLTGYYDYKVRMPFVIDFGGVLTIPKLTLAYSFRFRNWSGTRFVTDTYKSESDYYKMLSEENLTIASQYRQVYQARAGFEYLMEFNENFGISLRSGVAIFPAPDGDRHGDRTIISAGLGIPFGENMMMDAAFLSTSWSKQSSDSYTPYGAMEDVLSNRILVNVSYLFSRK